VACRDVEKEGKTVISDHQFGLMVFFIFGAIWYYLYASDGIVGEFITIAGLLAIAAIVNAGWRGEESGDV
jgi:hypothetical protein